MRVAFYSTFNFEKAFYIPYNHENDLEINFFETSINKDTALLAKNHDVVCVFANDKVTKDVVGVLAKNGIRLIALRAAGFNNIDMEACNNAKIKVVRVPEYSPYAVAEHTVALILTLNRKTHKAYNRVREGNFNLDGLIGFDLNNKTIGVIGTGKIGAVFCKIMLGFGCKVLAYDQKTDRELERAGVKYVEFGQLLSSSDIISLHIPLTPQTFHIINQNQIDLMKNDVVLVNTSRGALIDTKALIRGLKNNKIKAAGLDVYEEEEGLFFHDHSHKFIEDDLIARLITFPNVLITSHQAFLTHEALENIAQTTMENIKAFQKSEPLENQITI